MRKRYVVLLMMVGGWLSVSSQAATEPFFPKRIEFELNQGHVTANFQLRFTEELGGRVLSLSLEGFEAMGYRGDQRLQTRIQADDLSLISHVVLDGNGREIRSVRRQDDCESAFARRRNNCFKYTQRGEQLQTETFADYLAINLLSSIVVATREVPDRRFHGKSFNFIHRQVAKQVTLIRDGEPFKMINGREVPVTTILLKKKGTDFELYQFDILRDQKGFYPGRISAIGDQGRLEIIAKDVVWGN